MIMSSFDMLNIVLILYEQIPRLDLSLIDRNNAKQNKFPIIDLSPSILQQLQYNLYNARELF